MIAVNKPAFELNLSDYVRSFNPKQKVQKLPVKKTVQYNFIGGIKGTNKSN
jgi:hypothetical protein